jgi:hypothetical protein
VIAASWSRRIANQEKACCSAAVTDCNASHRIDNRFRKPARCPYALTVETPLRVSAKSAMTGDRANFVSREIDVEEWRNFTSSFLYTYRSGTAKIKSVLLNVKKVTAPTAPGPKNDFYII